MGRVFVVAQASQSGINRNERRRKNALAEEILKKIGNAKRRIERVGEVGEPEVMSQSALPNEADQAAQQDSGSDEESRARRRGWDRVRTGRGQGFRGGGRELRVAPSSSRRWRNWFSS